MVADVRDLVPRGKHDVDRARAAVEAGYPAVGPILGELIEWLQDYNWPVAYVLEPFLRSIGEPLVPHIWHVLRSDDEIWKYWVISLLITGLPPQVAAEFRPELERLAYEPTERERREELDEQARDALDAFGWTRQS